MMLQHRAQWTSGGYVVRGAKGKEKHLRTENKLSATGEKCQSNLAPEFAAGAPLSRNERERESIELCYN